MSTVELQEGRAHSKLPVIIPFAALALLAAGYIGLCSWASSSNTLFSGVTVLGQDLGGKTVEQAAETLSALPPDILGNCSGTLIDNNNEHVSDKPVDWDYGLSQLGFTLDAQATAQQAFDLCHSSFFKSGYLYLNAKISSKELPYVISGDSGVIAAAAQTIADGLNTQPIDTSYKLEENELAVTIGKDGCSVSAAEMTSLLQDALNRGTFTDLSCTCQPKPPAVSLTAQDIYDQICGQMKNAGYDAATGSITPEQIGADFDVARAQQLMDAANPGETVKIAATIQHPAVSAEQLKGVLFRDVLGSYTTHVGGSTSRISNVKLASDAINGTILNSGDIFDYNQVVGQRTISRGYQAAPAYVRGETVDEIGGGVCQPSSTLYLACLKSNLEIVERYAHRYVPAYIPKGMDATVSWGGPNYRFRNDTNYPIKVETVFSKNYLTMTLYGTKTDKTTVKMTNKVLSTTPYQTVFEQDSGMAAGTKRVKTTPYTGYKVETYRSLYDGEGKLISSNREAVSDYKVRNQVIVKGPDLPSVPASGSTSGDISVPETPDTPLPPDSGDLETPLPPITTEPLPEETPLPSETTDETEQLPDSDVVIIPLPAA